MTGALIGQETESGFFRGAAVGAISGAVFSIEVFEYFLLWQSDDTGVGCLLYLIQIATWRWLVRIHSLSKKLITDAGSPSTLPGIFPGASFYTHPDANQCSPGCTREDPGNNAGKRRISADAGVRSMTGEWGSTLKGIVLFSLPL